MKLILSGFLFAVLAFSQETIQLHFYDASSKEAIPDLILRLGKHSYTSFSNEFSFPKSAKGKRVYIFHTSYVDTSVILQKSASIFLKERIYYQAEDFVQAHFEDENSEYFKLSETSHFQSVDEVIKNEASVDIVDYGGGGAAKTLRIRGSQDKHSAVLIEGIRLNIAQNGWSRLNIVPLANATRLDLYKSASSAALGNNAVLGALNISYIPNFQSNMELRLQSSLHYYDRNYSLGEKKRNSSFKIDATEPDGRDYQFRILAPVNLFKRSILSFALIDEKNDNDFPYPYGTEFYERLGNEHTRKNYSLAFRSEINERLNFALLALYTDLQAGTPGAAIDYNPNTPRENLIDKNSQQNDQFNFYLFKSGYQFNAKNRLSASFAYHRQNLLYHFSSEHLNKKITAGIDYFTQLSFLANHLVYQRSYEELKGTAIDHAERWEDAFALNSSLPFRFIKFDAIASLSIRYNHFSNRNSSNQLVDLRENFFNYRFKNQFHLNNHRLSFAFGSNFVLPTFNDLFWPNAWGNPDLRYETSKAAQLNYRYSLHRIFSSEVDIFYNRYKDLIHWQEEGSRWHPVNLKRAEQIGFELVERFHFGSFFASADEFKFKLSYVLNRFYDLDSRAKQLPYTAIHSFSGELNYRYKSIESSLKMRFSSRELATNGDELYPFKRNIDFSLAYRFQVSSSIQFQPYLEIKNITNEFQESRRYFPLANRQFRLGLTINFKKE